MEVCPKPCLLSGQMPLEGDLLSGKMEGADGSLSGRLNGEDVLSGCLDREDTLLGQMGEEAGKLAGDLPDQRVVYVPDVEFYNGATRVTPNVEEQSIPTAGKLLREDIIIEEIPIYEVSNHSGGITVNIGG